MISVFVVVIFSLLPWAFIFLIYAFINPFITSSMWRKVYFSAEYTRSKLVSLFLELFQSEG